MNKKPPINVGTLPQRYICNAPLTRVPVCQRAKIYQVHTIPDYYKEPYLVPICDTPCSIVKTAAYAFLPAWHAIAINT
jgi:hypothetical protein